eukprot:638456-Amphidinium_carterae.1
MKRYNGNRSTRLADAVLSSQSVDMAKQLSISTMILGLASLHQPEHSAGHKAKAILANTHFIRGIQVPTSNL